MVSKLGGERVAITTEDEVKLDGMYFDAQNLRKKLSDEGCKLVSYDVKNSFGQSRKIQGILMPKGSENTLGKGWWPVKTGKNTVIFREDELMDERFFVKLKEGFEWSFSKGIKRTKEIQKIDVEAKAFGTVILTSGAAATYEQSRGEHLFYLLQNMNVMMFNFRGYGESEGVPTVKGLNKDMEAAYQMALAKSQHAEKQILFHALCMSGGPATYVAAKHPETNIFLDQSYSSFKEAVSDIGEVGAMRDIMKIAGDPKEGTLKRDVIEGLAKVISKLVSTYASFAIPDYKTSKYLTQNNGKKGFYFTKETSIGHLSPSDKKVYLPGLAKKDRRQVEKNVKALSKAGQIENVSVYSAPGFHGRALSKAHYKPSDYSDEVERLEKKIEVMRKENHPLQEDVEGELFYLKEELNVGYAPQSALHQLAHFLAKAGLGTSIFNLGASS